MHDLLQKIYLLTISAMMGAGVISPVPVVYEEEVLEENEQQAEVEESPAQEELPEEIDGSEEAYIEESASVWPTLIDAETYDVIKDINFDSCRIITAVDESYIFDKSVILSEYKGVYLLQFSDAETTKAAYAYLMQYADFIDVDTAIEVAEDDGSEDEVIISDTEMTEENNPFNELNTSLEDIEKSSNEETEEQPEEEKKKIVALIDSGIGHHETEKDEEGNDVDVLVQDDHVISSVSMIGEDTADDNGHGEKMLSFILEEAPEVQILSIKAIGENGKGDVSAIYAAMMYAIEQKVDIINLSISSPATQENAILRDAVQKATEAGITVVAAAGNNNKDARFYTPGNIDGVITIGSADENGEKLVLSNYGDCVDYNVISETTSEAAARFTGILYASSIEEVENSLSTGKVFEPSFEKSTVSIPDEVPASEEPPVEITDDTLTGDRGVTAIESLEASLIYGAVQEEYQGNQVWIWNANRSIEDHRFTYRFSYSTSGIDKLLPGEFEMRIPKSILINRAGNHADRFEIAIPLDTEVEDDDTENELAYRIDGDDIVIYNRIQTSAATEGYIEVSYFTTQKSYEYLDMGVSEPFFVRMKVKGATVDFLQGQTSPIPVRINTTAVLTSTSKKYPTLYKAWQPEWGAAPANAGDYWYLIWEVQSNIRTNTTQPYNFRLDDLIGPSYGWADGATEGSVEEVTIPDGAHSFVGYRLSGNSGFTNTNTVQNLRADAYRYDFVVTKLDKSVFEPLRRFEVTNTVDATLTPIDLIDAPTTAHSERPFKYERPEFKKPPGHFISWKRADGAYRTYMENYGPSTECIYTGTNASLTYLGMKGAEYTRYDLEMFKDNKVTYLDNFDYATWVEGYAWPWTLEAGSDWRDPDNYGKQPVRYELTDETFYLHEDGGISSDRLLTSADFQIDHLSVGVRAHDAEFNEDWQRFDQTDITWTDDDVLHIYAKYNGNYVLVADYYLKANTVTVRNSSIVRSVEPITNYPRSQRLFFNNNVVGFKLETSNAHYHTAIDAVPNIRLKNSTYVKNAVAEWPSIAIENTSHSVVDQTIGANTTVLYEDDDTDTDFAREIQRDSFIDKSVISTANEVKKKRYRITWKTKMYEQYTLGQGEKTYLQQESGTFYDLLPMGLSLDTNSIQVESERGYLPDNSFEYTQIPNFRNTGRTMLVVDVKQAGDYYNLYFDTLIDWNTITDFGRDVYNPIAYETGNNDIKDGYMDDGGELKEKELMSGLDENPVTTEKFLYSEENFDIVAITAASTGLTKHVKDSTDTDYSYNTDTVPNGNYTYRLRYANTFTVSSKNMILFDSMENYGETGMEGSNIVDHTPDWKGIVQSIDTTQLKLMGIDPVVYVSETTYLDLSVASNHDITNTAVWTEEETYLDTHSDLSAVKAIAIDMRKNIRGEDFILLPGQSVMAIIFMKAPQSAESDGTRIPETFNNIYLQNTTIDAFLHENDFYIHHDYTAIRFLIKGDIKVKKVSEDDENIAVPNIKFRLTGRSDYGTDIDKIVASDRNGNVLFKDIEKGSYTLQEYEATADWLEDHTEHSVVINGEGRTIIDGVDHTNTPIVITNKPRIHADINIRKKEPGVAAERVFEEDVWDPATMVKYAVSVYGIEQDYDQNGDKTGLTFGPATGVNYVNSYKSHTPTGKTPQGYDHRCIHDDSWDEICYWNFVDPYVYEQCVGEGCTHSVNLTLSQDLRNTNFQVNYTGDGPSVLYQELRKDNNYQHLTWNPLKEDGYNGNSTNRDGWGASRIRAMLNGVDELTMKTAGASPYGSNTNITFPVENYTSENAMINAFPEVLRNAIGYKAVKYDSVYNAKTIDNLKTSYDKLWLFSSYEIGDNTSILDSSFQHPLEALDDGMYQRFTENGMAISNTTSKTFFNGYFLSSNTDSTGTRANVYSWLRSVYSFDAYHNYALYAGNVLNRENCGEPRGISPGFTLSRNADEVESAMSASGSKPSWIDSVGGQQAQISFPALNGLIPDTTFKLEGTSDYGTDVVMVVVSNERGVVSFKNIEKGTYKIKELKENPNYVKDDTVWTVTIDDNGLVTTDLEAESLLYYGVENEPRYWDFAIRKVDAEDNNIWLQGATVNLSGISDLGTAYDITVTSDQNGKIQFEELERGTYVLTETVAPTGVDAQGHTGTGGTRNYLLDPAAHVLKINEHGVVKIDGLLIGSTGEHFYKNNRAMDGRIRIIKHWNYVDGEELPTPQLTLTSTEPGAEPTYTVTFDANGGVFDTGHTTNVVYITPEGSLNVIKEGEIKTPDPSAERYVFEGWYIDKACTIAYNPMTPLTANKTVYAKWRDTGMRYAVSVYGIGQDIDQNGNTMGLTFGPATGADYTNSFKRHDATGTTTGGHDHRCIHDDTWEEIVYWNDIDPDVYEQCVGECCTKSVPLELSDDLKNTSFQVNYTGDGPSALYRELYKNNNQQHNYWNPLTEGGDLIYGTNKNGWGGSRVRAVMNGADALTMRTADSSYATNAGTLTFPVENYTSDNALINAFPEVLQNAIGYKAVKYDSVYNSKTEPNLKTSYDKLWLLSSGEMGDSTPGQAPAYQHPLEALDDGVYQRFEQNSKLSSDLSQNFFKNYYLKDDTGSSAYAYPWMLRSIATHSYGVLGVDETGAVTYYQCAYKNPTMSNNGISPCFSLSRD